MAKPKAQSNDDLVDEPGPGHNSFSKADLIKILEALESLLAERSNLSEDIRAAMEVAAQKGFDKRTIREMIKMRALDQSVREERESLRDMYLAAIGLI